MKKIGVLIAVLGVICYMAYANAASCDKHSYVDSKTKQCRACPENATCNGKTFGCKKGFEKRGDSCEFRTAETCFYDASKKEWGKRCLHKSGSAQQNLCFIRVKPDQDTRVAKCSISADKHSVIAKGGRCKATYYISNVCK